MNTQIIQMKNLYCLMCEDKVSEVLNNVQGIIEHKTNVYTKELFVKYDPSIISLSDIIKHLNENNLMTVESSKFFLFDLLLILLYHLIQSSHNFFVLFIPTILLVRNFREFSMIRSSSILCYFMGLYLFFFDEYTVTSVEYFLLSVDITFYSLVSSITLSYIINISKINLYSISQVKNRYMSRITCNLQTENIPLGKLKIGDVILQTEGQVYVDGTIINGECIVDESDITGEESLKHKKINDKIISSTRIIQGIVNMRIDKIGIQSYTGKILSLIEDSEFKDLFRSSNNTVIITLSTSIFLSLIYFSRSTDEPIFLNTFKIFISTLISLCPCVFLISEPLIALRGRKYLLSHDIIMNDFHRVFSKHPDKIFIDKTGTLTEGYSNVLSYKIFENENENARIIKQMEKKYCNTVYGSIYRLFDSKPFDLKVEFVCGGGIRCKYKGREIRLGSRSFAINKKSTLKQYKKTIYYSIDYSIQGYFILSDNIVNNARKIINNLKNEYSKIVLLSGDEKNNVKRIAKKLDIQEYYYEMTSKDKLNTIRNNEKVIMIGDGINDIPAFRASSLSISVNQNNTSADFIIFSDGINKLPFLLKYIKRMNKKNRINYIFAVSYNIIILYRSYTLEFPCYSMYFSLLFIICNSLL